jgi:hypothetical protein
MQFSPTSCHFVSLGSKYSPQQPLLKYPQIYVLPLMSEIKFHTHTKLETKLYFVYCNFYGFRQHTKRQKVLNWMVASITHNLSALNFFRNQNLISCCLSQIFELCHVMKSSVSFLYVMILSRILVTRHQHNLSAFTSRTTSSLVSIRPSVFLFIQFILPSSNLHHQHRPAADVPHLISVPPDFPGLSYWYILKQSWQAMSIKHLLVFEYFRITLVPCQ